MALILKQFMEMITCTILLTVLVLFAVIIYLPSIKKNRRLPPGPCNLPILGYLPWIDSKMPYLSFTKLSQKFGPIYGLKLGAIYTVVISDSKILKTIFMKNEAMGKAPLYMLEKATQGKGLMCTEGNFWKNQRKFVRKFLRNAGVNKSSPNRKMMEGRVMKSISEFVKCLSHQDHLVLEPSGELLHMVGSVLGFLLLGKSWSRDDKTWNKIIQFMRKAEEFVTIGGPINFLPFLRFLPQFNKIFLFMKEIDEITKSLYVPIIENCVVQDNGGLPNMIHAFLEEKKLQQSDEIYNTQQLLILINEIFAAGLDTTVTAIYWFILHIAVYQRVQNKLRDELGQVLKNSTFSMDYIPDLPYLEATISEVMRIRVVEPSGVPHGCMEEFEISGYTIPKGTMIMPLLWAIHMNPKIWGDPEVFRPERFLNNQGKFHKPDEFVPFQAGKRVCVGEALGQMIIYTFAATILRKFKIELKDPSNVDLNGVCLLILAPKLHEFIFIKIQ